MKYSTSLSILLITCILLFESCQQPQKAAQVQTSKQRTDAWPVIQKEARPWTRWWWMGSAVDEKNIASLLRKYNQAGIGGVEIAPIYGAKGYESRYIPYLSPQWLQMLDFTVQKADSLGMGIDLTLGTGWPFGGPQVTPPYAASKLIVQTYKLSSKETLKENMLVKDPKQQETGSTLQALMAYNDSGEILNLLDKVSADGKLNWSPNSGQWELYAAFLGKTRQQVKRAAPGGEGYTLNHLSTNALQAYLKRFDEAFAGTNYGIRAFYNDSYEVYGADWSPDFFEAFQSRRGYDLRPHLRELVSKEENETIARLKADYRETMSEMVLENFTQPWTHWAHQQGKRTKNQAHGSPGNLLDLYATVDIPECETFGSSYFPIPGLRRDSVDIRNVDPDPVMLKFASSGAHAAGNNLVSCETFTWLGEHFKTSFSQCKPEVEQVFLAGVNHVFYHGVTYSPEDVPWPGWLFYASLNLTPANSLWPHFKGLNEYITRCQSVLQSGKPDNEILVYWPVYDFWNQPEGMEKLITVHAIDEWLHPTPFYKQVKQLMASGYSLDFVSDKLLLQSKVDNGSIRTAEAASEHQVLVIPQANYMPAATLEKVIQLAKDGATVIIEQLPDDVPGLHQLDSRKQQLQDAIQSLVFKDTGNGMQEMKTGSGQIILSADVQKALAYMGIYRETFTDTGLKFIRREIPGGKYYYLVNHTAKTIDTTIPLNLTAQSVIILDPQSGKSGLANTVTEGNQTRVKVQIQPGEALILQAMRNKIPDVDTWQYITPEAAPVAIEGEWNLHFTQGGPALPNDQKLHQLVSWTELPDEKAVAFSGTGEYTIDFTIPSKKADDYVLDLGSVRESARVWINGQEVGIVWSIPFQARVGQYLKAGKNTLTIGVANLMANRIRDMDKKGIEWRKYHEINFVNINYKDFDASGWQPQPSGLLGPVTLIPVKNTIEKQ